MVLKTHTLDPDISIIIPVYNSEKYLNKTLQSVLEQTMHNFEVIIINDGSTDSSIDIINNYASKYYMCQIINTENKGVSNARNLGIYNSRGKYLAFIDSDDFIAPLFLETLYNNIIYYDADISCCNYACYFPKTGISIPDWFLVSSGIHSSRKILNSLIKDVRMHFYIWNKLWKKSLFVENNIKFFNMCFEDIVASTELFYSAEKVAVSSSTLYYYTRHKGSTLSFIDKRKLDDYIRAFSYIRVFLESKGDYKKYRLSHTILGYRMMFSNILLFLNMKTPDKTIRSMINDIKNSVKDISYIIGDKFDLEDNLKYIFKDKKYKELYSNLKF